MDFELELDDNEKEYDFESLYPMSNFTLNAARNWGELF